MKKLSLFALLFLGGCYATAEPLFLPDGSAGYRISCGNYIGNMADCVQKAGDTCGAGGYQMYDQTGKALTQEAQDKTVITILNNNITRSNSSNTPQNMFVKCKAPPVVDTVVIHTPAPVDNQPIPLEAQ